MRKQSFVIAAALLALGGSIAQAATEIAPQPQSHPQSQTQTQTQTQPQPAAAKADNSALNARDQSGATLTPRDQSNASTDLSVEAGVRSAIYADKQLSTLAHNVKIVTANGTVTLRGPVRSAAEKARVASLAANTAGVVRVDNQIDVKLK